MKTTLILGSGLLALSLTGCDELPNNFPFPNDGGVAGTFSTDGAVDIESAFFTPQGTNGRSCATCHTPVDGWSINAATAQHLFDETDGLHPLFNIKDANRPDAPVSTVEEREEAYTMLLQGKFIRNLNISPTAEFEIVDFDDPVGASSLTKMVTFRRPLPTANFRSVTVSWDGGNTQDTLEEGLKRQARSNVTGAQQGPPADEETIQEIVDFELALSHAQMIVPGAGAVDSSGAEGGPEAASEQGLEEGPFTVFDAWENHPSPKKRQIWRGQKLFNDGDHNGTRCGGCHNAANNGQNVNGALFNVGASDPDVANDDMAVFTVRNKTTNEEMETTDPGRAFRTGLWSDMGRFKTPNIRGLASRAPYFHNGTAETLGDLVDHYEAKLGFDFTDQEEADLVAFLNAL